MAEKRSLLLAGFLGLCMGGIYVMPKCRMVNSAMNQAIPAWIGSWQTEGFAPSEKELKTLASDTEFSKAHCREYTPLGRFSGAEVDLSIVMSGEDLTNSIHRPERCMEAQGHKIHDSQITPIAFPDGRSVPTRRLLSVQTVEDGQHRQHRYRYVTYYFFVGHEHITSEHSVRNLIDMKDRLFRGEGQHWAYVLVAMPFGENGETGPRGEPLVSLETADEKVKELLTRFTADHISWDMLKDAAAPVMAATLH